MERWWLCWLVQVICLFGIICSALVLFIGPTFLFLGVACIGESAVLALFCIPDAMREERAQRQQRIARLERALGFAVLPPPAPQAEDRTADTADPLREAS